MLDKLLEWLSTKMSDLVTVYTYPQCILDRDGKVVECICVWMSDEAKKLYEMMEKEYRMLLVNEIIGQNHGEKAVNFPANGGDFLIKRLRF